MIKRIIDSRLPLIIYNPTKVFDKNYFKNIYDTGALPVFDTEFFKLNEVLNKIIELQNEEILFGIRIFTTDKEIIDFLNKNNIINLSLVVLSYFDKSELDDISLTNTFYKCFIETIDVDINDKLDKFSPHGLILKGNEAPGKVSKYTSFILMQWYLENSEFPVFIHGGVGQYTAAGIFAAGANGIVLDNQLFLSEEAPLSKEYKNVIANVEEKDTIVLGENLKNRFRVFSKLGTIITKTIKKHETDCILNQSDDNTYEQISKNIVGINTSNNQPVQSLFYLGQDTIFAKQFIQKSQKLKEIIYYFFKTIGECLEAVDEHDPMTAYSPLAKEHHTKYPIIQGPMANISDNIEFAEEIKKNGGLPFFALGNLPKDIVETLITNACQKTENFGVGLIGTETHRKCLDDHFTVIKKYKIPYALIAGGNASDVEKFEMFGIKTYIHTPSSQLLELALNYKATKIILEGTEAGGHVGNLTSFVLWENSINKILQEYKSLLNDISIIFAGGINSQIGSYFVSGLTSHLSQKGIKIGISVGTSYLFTDEAVETKALKNIYQNLGLTNKETIVIGSSVSLNTRTLFTNFSKNVFKKELERNKINLSKEERKHLFESDNGNALLIAAKAFYVEGFDEEKQTYLYKNCSEEEQQARGNFMFGDSVIQFPKTIRIEDLHSSLFATKINLTNNLNRLEILTSEDKTINDEIAIIGIGCKFPDAQNPEEYWKNIISKKYSIKVIPKERYNWDLFYESDKNVEDKNYSKLAACIDDFEFNFEKFGYSENEAKNISRGQQLLLEAAAMAVEDAGYNHENLPKDKTVVIIGDCTGPEFCDRHFKHSFPEIKYHLEQITTFNQLNEETKNRTIAKIKEAYDLPFNYKLDNVINNIEASLIAKYFGLESNNYSVDAACASSFVAIDCAVKSLMNGNSDCAIVGGVNTNFSPEIYLGFAKMGALSDDGSFPLDERANGFVIGEGAGIVVLKRLKDAIRDKDNIQGIIKGIGTSSDGKGKSPTAPNVNGQILAIKRCFEKIKTEISFDDIDYIEAHATSTTAGDSAEIETIQSVYKINTPIGISSTKSQIGHLFGGAGMAGLIRAVLSIKNKILPPNGNFEKISENIKLLSPFYVIKDPIKWNVTDDKTRKAAVNSFGFGGINAHIIIEEFNSFYNPLKRKIFSTPDYDFNDDRVVVISLGCVLPDANNPEEFFKNLENNKNSFYKIPESRVHLDYYDKDQNCFIPKIKAGIVNNFKFNSLKFRIPPSAVKNIDKYQLFAVESTSQVVEQTKLQEKLIYGNKIGVILGNAMAGENLFEHSLRARLFLTLDIIKRSESILSSDKEKIITEFTSNIRKRFPKTNEDTFPGFITTLISGRIANLFNCNGLNFVVDSASISSATAISLAIERLQCNDFEYVITGGSDSNLSPSILHGFNSWGMLTAKPCKPFSKDANGVNLGEGAALFLLTKYKTAKKNNYKILAELDNFSFKANPNANLTSPDKTSYKKSINAFYKSSSVNKKETKYIEVYGSSNSLFDLIELQSINYVFNKNLFWGNIKNNIGYLKSANPAVVLMKLILMNYHKKILPNSSDNSIVDSQSVLKFNDSTIQLKNNENRNFSANFFGIGGVHSHTVVSNLPLWMTLKNKKYQTIEITEQNEIPENPQKTDQLKTKIAVLLSGQGAQYVGMMKELYQSDEIIKSTLDKGEEIFKSLKGYSILEVMFNNEDLLIQTENTQPAVFLCSAAIYNYFKAKEIAPDYFIGHSLGEFSALYCSGMLDFDQTLKLIIKRSELMKEATEENPGLMIAVLKDERETFRLANFSIIPNIYIANKNSNNQTVVSGGTKEITLFSDYLKQKNISFTKVNVKTAFHSPYFLAASRKLRLYLETLPFKKENNTKLFSNVTGQIYPSDEEQIKNLIAKQMYSPVEFVKIVQNVSLNGIQNFIEIGPGKILSNLLKNINIPIEMNENTIDKKTSEKDSLISAAKKLAEKNFIHVNFDLDKAPEINENTKNTSNNKINEEKDSFIPTINKISSPNESFNINNLKTPQNYQPADLINSDEFQEFLNTNKHELNHILQENFLTYKTQKENNYNNKFGFYTGDIVIAGVSIGLPGTHRKVFDENNFDCILSGMNFIESVPEEEKQKMLDKNIISLDKDSNGNARFKEIKTTDDVIQLAARLGYFSLKDYGIDYDYDSTYNLAIAAGIEALKDAKVPLVTQYKKTTTGNYLDVGFALPSELQEKTGIVFSSVFSGIDSLVEEITKYYNDKFLKKPFQEFEKLYYFLIERINNEEAKEKITDWYHNLHSKTKDIQSYQFKKNLLIDLANIGAAILAQQIKAKGPNIHISAACASATHAIGIAEDWIRTNRCDRVIVVGGEDAASDVQFEWIGSTFLSMGIGTTKKIVSEAATPFDERRKGTIVGSAAIAMILEKEEEVKKRGLNGQAKVLGTNMRNSAFHPSRMNEEDIAIGMKKFIDKMEKIYLLNKNEYTKSLLFMSHETYTPARGGSASSEVNALRKTFPEQYKNITITNTKGFTGHTIGAGIEDAVMIKALQNGKAPKIANLKEIPENFKELKFSNGEDNKYEYGLHFAAGFGSHFSMLFVKRIQEASIENNIVYNTWLKKISGEENPKVELIHNTLCIASSKPLEEEQKHLQSEEKLVKPEIKFQQEEKNIISSLSVNGDILKAIKEIIAEQTGYTTDLLDDHLDLEADLGIDTVKQVEIFGKVSAKFNLQVPDDLKLSEYNTIAKLSDYIRNKLFSSDSAVSSATIENINVLKDNDINSDIARYIIKLKRIDFSTGSVNIFKDKTILVSKDMSGFADELIKQIKKYRGKVISIGWNNNSDYIVDFNSQESIEKQIGKIIKESNEINGFIHLAPIDYYFSSSSLDDKEINSSIKSFFLIVKQLFDQLNNDRGLIASIAFNSVIFPYEEMTNIIHPSFAGIAGMMKSINREMKDTMVKIVDFATEKPLNEIPHIIGQFINELMSEDRTVETGFKENEKFVLLFEESKPGKKENIIKKGSTILITGGARGITFEIIKSLVKVYQTNLIILGKSDISTINSNFLQKHVNEQSIFLSLKDSMKGVIPIELKKATNQILRSVEVYYNIEHLKSLGVKVTYECVDVSNEKMLSQVIKKYKEIDGIIHAAGVDESNYITKKDLASFNRVFDTKVKGTLNLINGMDHKNYDFFIAFSSIAAKIGNEGQTDYSAANDTMGKIIQKEKIIHPERTYKIFDWTAWKDTGMAANESVQKVLKEKGFEFLSIEEGIFFFMNELKDKKTDEIIIFGKNNLPFKDIAEIINLSFDSNNNSIFQPQGKSKNKFSFLDKEIFNNKEKNIFSRTLDIERDLYIKYHIKSGIPIFPGAFGIEAMAQASYKIWNDRHILSQVSDFKIPYGIKLLKGESKEIIIESEIIDFKNKIVQSKIKTEISNKFKKNGDDEKLHFEGLFHFSEKLEETQPIEFPYKNNILYDDNLIDLLYHPERIFPGELFYSINELFYFKNNILVCKVKNTNKKLILGNDYEKIFTTDVMTIDGMFQTTGIFEFLSTSNILLLPYEVKSIKFYKKPNSDEEYFCITKKIKEEDKTFDFQIDLIDKNKNLIIRMEQAKMVKMHKVPLQYQITNKINYLNV